MISCANAFNNQPKAKIVLPGMVSLAKYREVALASTSFALAADAVAAMMLGRKMM